MVTMAQEQFVAADPEILLNYFRGHEDFVERQPLWTAATTELFSRLARAVNKMGLDWWYTRATNSQLRFGRKNKGVRRGGPVGWLHLRNDGVQVKWDAFAGLDKQNNYTNLTDELVKRFEAAAENYFDPPPNVRNAFWPNGYSHVQDGKSDDDSKNKENTEDESRSDGSSKEGIKPKNVIYYGPPGTGKTHELLDLLERDYTDDDNDRCYEFVTFHQSYGYEEFVEGLRPVIIQRDSEAETAAPGGEVRYEIKRGAFLRLCDRARKYPDRRYAMVIDEINRGNISKIFGELITLVEVDKREGAKYPVSVTLPYSGTTFSVPLNVDVIGTMNTADRSLALVDTALRRRFEFIEKMPDPDLLKGTIVCHQSVNIDLKLLLTTLNKRIEALYDRDHTVGHAYFTHIIKLEPEKRFSELQAVFRNKIIPLLEEYFFEDWQKIRLVLGDNQKNLEAHQFVREIGREDDLQELFGTQDGLDQYAIRSRYELNTEALDEPIAYVGIYEKPNKYVSAV